MKKRTNRRKAKTASVRNPKRKLGTFQDTITIAGDFDAPLPHEILDAFEGVAEEKQSNPSSQ